MEAMEVEAEGKHPRWHKRAALSTLLMAVLAAIGAKLSGITSNQALMERTRESIEISILEGNEVEVAIIRAKHDILSSLGETSDQAEVEIGTPVEMVTRRLRTDGDERGMLVYGYKFRPRLERVN
jgi:hypothetical protein